MATLTKKVVTPQDLSTRDFTLNENTKKIELNVPQNVVSDLVLTGNTLTYNQNGQQQTMDLSRFAVDVSVDRLDFNPANGVLTLTQDEGGKTVTIDLSELAATNIANPTANAVTLSGDGKTATPLKADVKISNTEGNLLKKDNGSLKVMGDDVLTHVTTNANKLTLTNAFGETIGTVIIE